MSGLIQRLVRPVRLPSPVRRAISSRLPSWRTERDVLLILRWLAGDLTPREKARVEERLMFDDQFHRYAGQLIYIKSMRLGLARRYPGDAAKHFEETGRALPVPREQKARAYAAVRARLGLPARTMEQYEQSIASYSAMADQLRASHMPLPLPDPEEEARAYRERRAFRMYDRQMRRFRAALLAALALTAAYVSVSTYQFRVEAAHHVQEATQHRATTSFLLDPSVHDAGTNVFDAVTLDGGAQAILSPGSRLSVSGFHLALDGHAQLSIPETAPYLMVRTAVGSMLLLPGRYDVDAPIGGEPSLVSVHAGLARVWANDREHERLVVRAGHEARVTASSATLVK